MADWATFRHILVRQGIHVKYFWSKEFTVKGQRHLHAVINAYIPQNVIKDAWQRATDGESFIVWITGKDKKERCHDIYNPAGYAMKYITQKTIDTGSLGILCLKLRRKAILGISRR
jgi:hypothetical protein